MDTAFVSRIGTDAMAMNGFYADIEAKVGSLAGESRALVALEPAVERRPPGTAPAAPFLTQLLAVKAGVPQTRERRRAEPDEATQSYEMSMAPRPPRAGRMLTRAM
jgi:hypothetical protein